MKLFFPSHLFFLTANLALAACFRRSHIWSRTERFPPPWHLQALIELKCTWKPTVKTHRSSKQILSFQKQIIFLTALSLCFPQIWPRSLETWQKRRETARFQDISFWGSLSDLACSSWQCRPHPKQTPDPSLNTHFQTRNFSSNLHFRQIQHFCFADEIPQLAWRSHNHLLRNLRLGSFGVLD